jgi:3-phenylpropionate/trans-cinnamate dioxygenase ferredoxin reductase subunit
MADRRVDFLLIGGGIASAQCAAQLRKLGADGSILLVGREADPPYDRPPLSKDYLRGESERADGHAHPLEWYEENDVKLLSGRGVMSLDASARTVKLQGGEEVGFGKALLATGAMVNILRLEGAELDGIHYLRTFGNSDSIRADVAEAEHVVLVGGSYIGAEVSASLTEMGKRCTIIEMEETVLSGSFGAEVGRHFHELLESKGVEIIGGESVAAFEGEGRVSAIRTASGRTVECDAAVVGAGVRPDTMLAGRAGLTVDDGIVCDSSLQTSAEGIFAAGDCCSYESEIHGRRLRVENWDHAFQQGRHAARGMLGEREPYRVVPYFFSDLSDWAALEYVGPARTSDDVVWRGERESGEFSAWYLEDDRVAAALSVGRSEDLQHARRLIESGDQIGSGRAILADPDADLDQLGSPEA